VVGMASFQLQADTGRGTQRKREIPITLETVRGQIHEGAGTKISWDTILIGHPKCHRIGITLEANGNLYDLNDDPAFFNGFLEEFKHIFLDRRDPKKVVFTLAKAIALNPKWIWKAFSFFGRKGWRMRRDIVKSGGKVHKLSFFMQNFMDADSLDSERVHACSFMVMTADGPVSMCAHNARRDEYILKKVSVTQDGAKMIWNPLTGKVEGHTKKDAA
jgi:7,8-dihydro-6-hydroxymethylpterin dimethyltransferase